MASSIAETFYQAFQDHDTEKMGSLYHKDAKFKDPAFGKLNANEVRAMWKMLLERSKGELNISYQIIEESAESAICTWEAQYNFGPKKRPIHNKIVAHLLFKEGKIIGHTNKFNFWKWAGMALGPSGWILGFTPIVKNKVNKTVKKLLDNYMRENLK